MVEVGGAPRIEGGEDDVDGCDMEFHDGDATPDAELPVAVGGTAPVAQGAPGEEDDVDGCDVELAEAEATKDEDLPVAVGGVG